MLELVADYQRSLDALELRFMSAIRIGVPASLDDKARGPFEKRERKLKKNTDY